MEHANDSEDSQMSKPEALLDHLQRKWMNFFKLFDVDRDSVWTESDLKSRADNLVCSAGNMLSDSGAAHVRRQSQHWLRTQEEELCEVGPGGITADMYCQKLREVFEKRDARRHLLKELDIYSEIFFDIIDINRDGKISLSELTIFYKAMGVNNEQVIDIIFSSLDLVGDGFVSREEFRIAYREYFFGDQRERHQIIPYLFDQKGLLLKQRESFFQDD